MRDEIEMSDSWKLPDDLSELEDQLLRSTAPESKLARGGQPRDVVMYQAGWSAAQAAADLATTETAALVKQASWRLGAIVWPAIATAAALLAFGVGLERGRDAGLAIAQAQSAINSVNQNGSQVAIESTSPKPSATPTAPAAATGSSALAANDASPGSSRKTKQSFASPTGTAWRGSAAPDLMRFVMELAPGTEMPAGFALGAGRLTRRAERSSSVATRSRTSQPSRPMTQRELLRELLPQAVPQRGERNGAGSWFSG